MVVDGQWVSRVIIKKRSNNEDGELTRVTEITHWVKTNV